MASHPPLASLGDLSERVGDLADSPAALVLLRQASAIVRAFAGRSWVNADGELAGVPDGVPEVVTGMVERVLQNPTGVTQDTTGPFTTSWGSQAAQRLYLTAADKLILRGGRQKAFSIDPTPPAPEPGPPWWVTP